MSLARKNLSIVEKLEVNPKALTADVPGSAERIAILKLALPDANPSFSDLWETYRKAQAFGLDEEIETLLRPVLVRAVEGAARTGAPTNIREAFLVARLTKSLPEVQPAARRVVDRFCGDPQDLTQVGIALECARELPDQEKLIEKKIRPAALKALQARDLPIDGNDYASVCAAVGMLQQLQLREGVRYAVKAVGTDGRFADFFRGQAVKLIADLAGPDDVASIEPLITNTSPYGVNTVDGKEIKTQCGDVCLATVISVTKQNPADYGLFFTGPPANLWGFETAAQREAAIKKWRAFRSRERK